jgi:hypothetical protein
LDRRRPPVSDRFGFFDLQLERPPVDAGDEWRAGVFAGDAKQPA